MADVKSIQRPLSPKDQRRNAEQAERDLLRLTSAGNNNSATVTGRMVIDDGDIDIVNEGSINAVGQALDYLNSLRKVTTSLANRLRWNVNVGAWVLTSGIWFGSSDTPDTGDSPRVSSDYGKDVTATSAIIPTLDSMTYYGPTIVQKSNFVANQYSGYVGSSAFDSTVNSNGTGQTGQVASSGVATSPDYVSISSQDNIGNNYFNAYFRANVPAADYWSQNYLSLEWQIRGQPNVSIKVTPARRFSVTAVGVDLNSPVNIAGLLAAQAITATDITASGTVQAATLKATGAVQATSGNFSGDVTVSGSSLVALLAKVATLEARTKTASARLESPDVSVSVPNATWTRIYLQTTTYADPGMITMSSGRTDRIIITMDGLYDISASGGTTSTTTGTGAARWSINGVARQPAIVGASANGVAAAISDRELLKAGDYVTLEVFQSSGAARTPSSACALSVSRRTS